MSLSKISRKVTIRSEFIEQIEFWDNGYNNWNSKLGDANYENFFQSLENLKILKLQGLKDNPSKLFSLISKGKPNLKELLLPRWSWHLDTIANEIRDSLSKFFQICCKNIQRLVLVFPDFESNVFPEVIKMLNSSSFQKITLEGNASHSWINGSSHYTPVLDVLGTKFIKQVDLGTIVFLNYRNA